MQRDDLEDTVTCLGCGRDFLSDREPGYFFGEDGVLCADCAVARGGRYDPEIEAWEVAPNIGELPDERRAHP